MYAHTFRSELPSIGARTANNLQGCAAMHTAFSVMLRLGTAAACSLAARQHGQPSPACTPRWVLSFAAPGLLLGDGLQHRVGTGCISSFCSSLYLSCFSRFTVCRCPSVLAGGRQHKLYDKHSCLLSAFGDRISIRGPDSGMLQTLGIALYGAVTAVASLGTDVPQHLTDAHPALLGGIGWGREESRMTVPVLPRPGLCPVRRSTPSGFCH